MKIKKIYDGEIPENKIMDEYTESTSDTYSCNFINNKQSSPLTVYPVGAIYISAVNTSPASLFGGTWVQLKSRFLYASSANENTGGANGKDNMSNLTGTTVDSQSPGLPSHSHNIKVWVPKTNSNANIGTGSYYAPGGIRSNAWYVDVHGPSTNDSQGIYYTGSGSAHSHNIPYIAVYVWQRTE